MWAADSINLKERDSKRIRKIGGKEILRQGYWICVPNSKSSRWLYTCALHCYPLISKIARLKLIFGWVEGLPFSCVLSINPNWKLFPFVSPSTLMFSIEEYCIWSGYEFVLGVYIKLIGQFAFKSSTLIFLETRKKRYKIGKKKSSYDEEYRFIYCVKLCFIGKFFP